MKVLYTTTAPAPYKVDMFEYLGKLCDLTVVFECSKQGYREDSWLRKEFTNFTAIFIQGFIFRDRLISRQIVDIIQNENFDRIIIGMYSTPSNMIAMEYMRRKKVPYILSSDGGFIKKDTKLAYIIKKRYIGAAEAWLSTGEATNEYLVHYGANTDNIYIYPFSSVKKSEIQEEDLSPNRIAEIRSELGVSEEKCVISVGQFIYRKGFDVLINACEFVSGNVGIYIIGGTPTEEYNRIMEKKNLQNIHFVGFKSKEELRKYYQAADLFVLPTREDIWGLVINEALANGLPVVTTEKCVAGLEMITEGVTGYIVPTNDSIALAEAINKALLPNCLSRSRCREKASSYTVEDMAERHYEILSRME